MIFLYSGTCGSGKSFHAAKDIVDWIKKKNKYIITNMPIDIERVAKISNKSIEYVKKHLIMLDNEDITTDFLYRFSAKKLPRKTENACLLLIDEAGDIFNPREWDKGDRMAWLKFFRTHRHYGYRCILISQNDRYIDRQIRGVIETEIKHRNIRYYKTFGLILSLITGGMFVCVEYWYPMKLRDSSNFMFFNKRIGNLYNTFQNFNLEGLDDTSAGAGNGVQVVSACGAPLTDKADNSP